MEDLQEHNTHTCIIPGTILRTNAYFSKFEQLLNLDGKTAMTRRQISKSFVSFWDTAIANHVTYMLLTCSAGNPTRQSLAIHIKCQFLFPLKSMRTLPGTSGRSLLGCEMADEVSVNLFFNLPCWISLLTLIGYMLEHFGHSVALSIQKKNALFLGIFLTKGISHNSSDSDLQQRDTQWRSQEEG